jgi:hypothetical protein
MGDKGGRRVDRHTHLLYHWNRCTLPSQMPITSEKARLLTDGLDQEDKRIMGLLLTHLLGTDEPSAMQWKSTALRRLAWLATFRPRSEDIQARSLIEKDTHERMEALEKNLMAAHSVLRIHEILCQHLEMLFLRDEKAALLDVWALDLIDHIDEVTPVLTTDCRAHITTRM